MTSTLIFACIILKFTKFDTKLHSGVWEPHALNSDKNAQHLPEQYRFLLKGKTSSSKGTVHSFGTLIHSCHFIVNHSPRFNRMIQFSVILPIEDCCGLAPVKSSYLINFTIRERFKTL